ncbi:hypothetical protein ACF06Q_08205 [Streptomyces leeuwenhoekii]|uniref:alpha-L-rhamnosidase-related protein n=1 Tax=Streptomyces leeuwenhoekii TaxID=1437453 RepID=UPI0036FF6A11
MRATECPSWLYPVTMGATTIWERSRVGEETRGTPQPPSSRPEHLRVGGEDGGAAPLWCRSAGPPPRRRG